jgi:hypothetical protein
LIGAVDPLNAAFLQAAAVCGAESFAIFMLFVLPVFLLHLFYFCVFINLLDKACRYLYTLFTIAVTVFSVYVRFGYCCQLISLSLKH